MIWWRGQRACLQHELDLLPLEKEKFRHVLEAAHLHAEYLVVSDRKFLH